jgi:hypothetical protein
MPQKMTGPVDFRKFYGGVDVTNLQAYMPNRVDTGSRGQRVFNIEFSLIEFHQSSSINRVPSIEFHQSGIHQSSEQVSTSVISLVIR